MRGSQCLLIRFARSYKLCWHYSVEIRLEPVGFKPAEEVFSSLLGRESQMNERSLNTQPGMHDILCSCSGAMDRDGCFAGNFNFEDLRSQLTTPCESKPKVQYVVCVGRVDAKCSEIRKSCCKTAP